MASPVAVATITNGAVSSESEDTLSEENLSKERKNMLWTIFVILLVLWALGMVTSYTMGGLVHLLLVLAVVVVVLNLVRGRRSVV